MSTLGCARLCYAVKALLSNSKQVTAAHIFNFHDDDAQNLGTPEWEWPPYRESYSTSSKLSLMSLEAFGS